MKRDNGVTGVQSGEASKDGDHSPQVPFDSETPTTIPHDAKPGARCPSAASLDCIGTTGPVGKSHYSDYAIAFHDQIEQLAISRIATWLYQKYASKYRPTTDALDICKAQAKEIWDLVRHYPSVP